MFLSNDQIAAARDVINGVAGSRRAMGHGIVTPGAPGWLDEVDRVLETAQATESSRATRSEIPCTRRRRRATGGWTTRSIVYPLYEKMLKARRQRRSACTRA